MEPPLPVEPLGRIARSPCSTERRPEVVHLELRAHPVRVELGDELGDLDARVVDEDVQPAELLDRRRNRALPRGVVVADEAVPVTERRRDAGARVLESACSSSVTTTAAPLCSRM